MNFSTANLIENYASRECLEQLGWSCVPELDCNGLTTWAETSNLAIRKGYETQPLKQWFAKPLALRNQGVFTVDNAFCREVENIGSKNQWSGLFRKYKLNGTTRKVSDMDTSQSQLHVICIWINWYNIKFRLGSNFVRQMLF